MKKEKSPPTTAVANPAVRITGAATTAVAPKAAVPRAVPVVVKAPVATVAVPAPKNPPIAALVNRELPKAVVLTVVVVAIGMVAATTVPVLSKL